ncbi:AP3-complex subunit beta-A-like isoform X2 [Papaver somniferum]|uniref:AP3-complex subunit beta-A-like isoform X2 n=1 Tax=Papaver somniferum TaxID=3469 RepID=UPI000E6F76B1|nr:AP3-complex subunit beta-A-like isoform X2 [Papaver somniferum]
MFPQFGSTSETLSKASSVMFRIGTDAHLYDDPDDVNIIPLLDSRFDSEKFEALKRLLALIAQGVDVSNFFPQVVKNVASQSLEVKKLVYLYLLHYAEKRPNEALLSINCFQKDLSDTNPLVRAWALRAMAGIRLHAIAPLVLVAVSKCARDPSVYVRKCAANALPKLNDLHQEENTSSLVEIVGILLCDHSPGVVGAAAAAFNIVCPNNLSVIGKNFKKLCQTLPDVEEWGQIVLIGILLRYVVARHGLVKESILFCSHDNHICDSEKKDEAVPISNIDEAERGDGNKEFVLTSLLARCYIEGPDEYVSRSSYIGRDTSGVDNAAAGVHWIMSPKGDVRRIVKPLLFLLRSSDASKYVVLCNIQVFAKAMPSLFTSHFEDFFVCLSDSYQIKALKLGILSIIATDASIPFIFQEFQDYIRDTDRRFVVDTIAAIGLCAQRLPTVANTCLEGLLALTRQESLTFDASSMDGEANVLAQAIMSIKAIIKQDPVCHEKAIIQLARSLDSIKVPVARAMIVWMVGEYNSVGLIIPRMLATILQYLARCFTTEAAETKNQILNTALKVVLYGEGEDTAIYRRVLSYVLQLAKCDPDYDIRDRAHILENLLFCYITSESLEEGMMYTPKVTDIQHMLVKSIFGGNKKPVSPAPNNYRVFLPGSLSQIVLHAAPGYEPLPKPCSLPSDELGQLEMNGQSDKTRGPQTANDHSFDTNEQDTFSGSLNEESGSDYSSRDTVTRSDESEGTGSASQIDEDDPLIQLLDVSTAEKTNLAQFSDDLGGLMSKGALESWLDDQPRSSELSSSKLSSVQPSLARLSIRDIGARVKPRSYSLLHPSNGNGLKVDYSFSSETSSISPTLVCIEVSFQNCSTEPLEAINLADEDSTRNSESTTLETYESSSTSSEVPTLVAGDDIVSIQPGQTMKRIFQVHFHHHLLPLSLAICCSGKRLPVKLRPDIGYFVKPLQMNIEAFHLKESQLPGMFEYSRKCIFKDHIIALSSDKEHSTVTEDNLLLVCRSLASQVLSNASFFLVSVDMPVSAKLDDASGLSLRFSCEILSNSIPCLITVTVEGKCSEQLSVSVKVNCEETIFGLNLLNRVVAFLS